MEAKIYSLLHIYSVAESISMRAKEGEQKSKGSLKI
jgi:hypothetical protein